MGTFETKEQVSAGGVVYRRSGARVEVALISVGEAARWVALEEAEGMFAFKGERKALEQAREMFAAGAGG